MKNERQLVLPGDVLDEKGGPGGLGTKTVDGKTIAVTSGLLDSRGDRVSIIPLNGVYEPRPGDTVIGTIAECNPGNWIVDIRGPTLAPMHVSEAPWRVDFGETVAYLKPGDAILCKILFVDGQKKVQVTLKDRNLAKLEGGELMEVPPVKVPRVIGRGGSMLNLIKSYLECWMYVGQNGRIWLNGDPDEVLLARRVIEKIANEAHLPGLTDRIKAFLEAERPGGVDLTLGAEEE